jgi:hypothetical protein
MKIKREDTEEGVYDVVDRMRAKPPLYIGERSLERLFVYLAGISAGVWMAGNNKALKDAEDFHRFHDWVAKRLGFYESTSGWHKMIRIKCADESEALDRFYVLLDEFRAESKAAKAR